MASIDMLSEANITMALIDDALGRSIRTNLKERLMKIAEDEINQIVETSLQDMKTHIEAYREAEFMRTTVKVLVEKRGFGNG